LSYPEKRLFFQEGNEMFGTRIRTFYSRRIQDIGFGGKLNGKIGKYQINALNTRSLSIPEENEPAAFYTAARVKRDFLKSSVIGATFVDKTTDTSFTRSISTDYVLNLNETWKLTGQFVGSTPGDIAENLKGDFRDNSAWFVRFARENNIYHYHIRYTEIGNKFQDNVNQTGFITDDNRREMDSDISYKWWLKNNTFEYIAVETRNNVFWNLSDGPLRSWYITESVNFYFKNKFNFEYSYNNEFKAKDDVLYEKDFRNHKHTFTLGYNTDEWSHASVSYTTGDNFDRDLNLISGGARVKLFENLSLSYSTNYLHYNPDPGNRSTFLNVITANYNFTKDLWLKVFAQNSTKNDNIYFYGLMGWRFKPPFGALYLIYSHDQYADEIGLPKTDNFFLKLTYPISIVN